VCLEQRQVLHKGKGGDEKREGKQREGPEREREREREREKSQRMRAITSTTKHTKRESCFYKSAHLSTRIPGLFAEGNNEGMSERARY
jgi:hypothetical protein